jgi:hypothetical protein
MILVARSSDAFFDLRYFDHDLSGQRADFLSSDELVSAIAGSTRFSGKLPD